MAYSLLPALWRYRYTPVGAKKIYPGKSADLRLPPRLRPGRRLDDPSPRCVDRPAGSSRCSKDNHVVQAQGETPAGAQASSFRLRALSTWSTYAPARSTGWHLMPLTLKSRSAGCLCCLRPRVCGGWVSAGHAAPRLTPRGCNDRASHLLCSLPVASAELRTVDHSTALRYSEYP